MDHATDSETNVQTTRQKCLLEKVNESLYILIKLKCDDKEENKELSLVSIWHEHPPGCIRSLWYTLAYRLLRKMERLFFKRPGEFLRLWQSLIMCDVL